jgi:hypothetical protein
MGATAINRDRYRLELWNADLTDQEAGAVLDMTEQGYKAWRKKNGLDRPDLTPIGGRRAGEYDVRTMPAKERRRIRRFTSDLIRAADGRKPKFAQISKFMETWVAIHGQEED